MNKVENGQSGLFIATTVVPYGTAASAKASIIFQRMKIGRSTIMNTRISFGRLFDLSVAISIRILALHFEISKRDSDAKYVFRYIRARRQR